MHHDTCTPLASTFNASRDAGTISFSPYMAFNLPYVYDYVTKLCRQQAEDIQNHENDYVHGIGQGEARHRKYKGLKLHGGQAYDRSCN
jgi:hypothetical protein